MGLDPKSQALMELINKYGLKRVPPEELKKLGFVYDKNQNIVKKETAIKRAEKIVEAEKQMEKKREATPFGKIEISLGGESHQLRHETKLAIRFDVKYRCLNDSFAQYLPSDSPIIIFVKKLEELHDQIAEQEEFRGLPTPLFWSEITDPTEISIFNKNIEEELEMEGGGAENTIIALRDGTRSVEEFYESIQRARARFTDLDLLKKELIGWGKLDEFGSEEVDFYCKLHNISSEENLDTHIAGAFLITCGFEKIGREILSLKTYAQALDRISKISGSDFPHLVEKKKVEELMKKATTVEEKKALSKQKKELDSKSRWENKIIEGIKEYFSQHVLVAKFFKNFLDDLEEALFRTKKDNAELTYFLDASINAELDKDPGAISGDCTEGKPLPFGDPNIPVFNVKVFNNESRHIGNIYLLITQTDSGKTVWHLDAIQIPASINWETSGQKFFDSLGEQAKKKGIQYITINDSPGCISNYDYIGEPLMSKIESENRKKIRIELPEVKEESYSNFQSHGTVYVVWENK